MKASVALTPLIPYWEIDGGDEWQIRWSVSRPIELEIGFGLGEVLVERARRHPERNFIGIEQNWERTWRTLKKITEYDLNGTPKVGLNNIHIFFCDARFVLKRFFTSRNLEHIYCLFPCPWPKASHAKHRLFQKSFFELLNNRLVDGGTMQIVTDHLPYHQDIEQQVQECGFIYKGSTLSAQFQTKFEKKWQAQGQNVFFETVLTKERHCTIPLEKDFSMKSFRLKHFVPDNFFPDPYRDSHCTVVCKDVLYDERKQTAVILVLVAEGELTQHFRVVIFKRDDYWRVCKCDGQTFLPTPGINQAIQHVYDCASAGGIV